MSALIWVMFASTREELNVCLASSSSAYLLWVRVTNRNLLQLLWDTTKGLWSQIRNETPPFPCVGSPPGGRLEPHHALPEATRVDAD